MMDLNIVRNVLNVVFMVLALAAVITFFVATNSNLYIIVCGVAVVVKLMERIIRFTTNKKDKL